MSVSSENSLIIHNVESLSTLLFFWNRWIKSTILGSSILVFISDNLRLCTFKTLRHILILNPKNKICLKVLKVHNRKLSEINTSIEEPRMVLFIHLFQKKRRVDKLSTLCMIREFSEETLIINKF
jgi:hypothetical protein